MVRAVVEEGSLSRSRPPVSRKLEDSLQVDQPVRRARRRRLAGRAGKRCPFDVMATLPAVLSKDVKIRE
jgi:hypothetical protein